MSRQRIAAHYSRISARWPQDLLRPERPFTKILEQRIQNPPVPFRPEDKEVNAAYLLLDNVFSKRFALPENLLRPQSNPEFYTKLKRDLEEAPNQTRWNYFVNRLKRMIRFK